MSSWTRVACPVDGARLVQVASTNVAGDAIHRWECPLGDWSGPWYTGLDVDEIHQIPETGRVTSFDGRITVAGAAGTEYTEGAVDATITGTAILWEDAGDTLRAVSATNRLPVSLPAGGSGLTDAELRATPVPVSGTITATGPLTDAQLRAVAVPVSGTVSTGGLTDAQLRAVAVPVSGPLTDAQLRAVAVPVSGTVTATGPLTDTQLRATPVPVSGTVSTGGLTDTQLRATPVPVSGTVTATGPLTDTQLRATPVPVSGTVTATGPLTDAQLRASAVPVSLAANQSVNNTQINGVAIAVGSGASSTGTQRVIEAGPAAADILVGHLAHTATTAAATVITVPINRVWRGTITVTCDVSNAATAALVGQALGVITTTGASAVPAAGTIASCEARLGVNAATGTHGTGAANSITIPIVISAGATALATVALTTTITGTAGRVACIASGVLI